MSERHPVREARETVAQNPARARKSPRENQRPVRRDASGAENVHVRRRPNP